MGEFFVSWRYHTSVETTTFQETSMLTLFIFAILLFPITLGASALTNLFSPDELKEMGVCLENSHV
jgi:hypothetical protein